MTLERVSQPCGLALGDDDMRVMEKAIDGGGRQTRGKDGVEATRVQIGRQDQAALLVGGVDQAIEGLGFVLAGRQEPYVVDYDQLAKADAGHHQLGESLHDVLGGGIEHLAVCAPPEFACGGFES